MAVWFWRVCAYQDAFLTSTLQKMKECEEKKVIRSVIFRPGKFNKCICNKSVALKWQTQFVPSHLFDISSLYLSLFFV